MKKKVLIIGGGISGLSAAWKLSENGYETLVIESEDQIGGLAKSIKFKKYILDIGPHSFFTENKEIFDKIVGLFKDEPNKIPYSKRTVKMYFRGKYVDYPLSMKSILLQMGILPPIFITLSFLKSYLLNPKKNKLYDELSVEEWAINNFGKYLFSYFFKPYTEQFWKISPSELSHRVIPSSKKMDFVRTLKHILLKKFLNLSKREHGEASLVERESLPSYYPKNGFGEIADRIKKKILDNRGQIFTNCSAEKINFENHSIEISTNQKTFEADYVISTIPLKNLVKIIYPRPSEIIIKSSNLLEHLCLVLVYIITRKKNVLNCQYCYFVNKPYNRISEMNFFSEHTSPKDESLLALEISCHFNDSMWNKDEKKIFDICIESMEKDNLINKNDVMEFKIIKVKDCYPIYRKGYEKNLNEVQNFLNEKKNFYSVGRQGQFYYGDIDQMAEIGFDAADKIISTE